MRRTSWILAFLASTTFLSTAWAVDGVILIDQSRALAGNITPGDTPGFPITISQSGSYRLSSNLSVPSGFNAIVLTAANVTIDLNGFTITTPVQAPGGGKTGIINDLSVAPNGITVRNGNIEGFVAPFSFYTTLGGGQACRYCTFENLVLRWGFPTGASSIDLGSFTRVHNVTAVTHNINVYCPSVVTNSVALGVGTAIDFPGDADVNQGTCTFAHNSILNP